MAMVLPTAVHPRERRGVLLMDDLTVMQLVIAAVAVTLALVQLVIELIKLRDRRR